MFKPAQAAEFRRPIVYRSSLCAMARQFHDDLAVLILLSDVQCCLSCSVLGIYALTVPQQPSNQQHVPTRQAKWRAVFPSSLACIIGKRL
jgi:hypothetical protein